MERKSFKTLLTAFFVIFLTSAQGQISKTFDPIDIFEIICLTTDITKWRQGFIPEKFQGYND